MTTPKVEMIKRELYAVCPGQLWDTCDGLFKRQVPKQKYCSDEQLNELKQEQTDIYNKFKQEQDEKLDTCIQELREDIKVSRNEDMMTLVESTLDMVYVCGGPLKMFHRKKCDTIKRKFAYDVIGVLQSHHIRNLKEKLINNSSNVRFTVKKNT